MSPPLGPLGEGDMFRSFARLWLCRSFPLGPRATRLRRRLRCSGLVFEPRVHVRHRLVNGARDVPRLARGVVGAHVAMGVQGRQDFVREARCIPLAVLTAERTKTVSSNRDSNATID